MITTQEIICACEAMHGDAETSAKASHFLYDEVYCPHPRIVALARCAEALHVEASVFNGELCWCYMMDDHGIVACVDHPFCKRNRGVFDALKEAGIEVSGE